MNIILHIIFILVVLYYILIYNTGYDEYFYRSINELKYELYKNNKKIHKDIKKYQKRIHREEDRKEHITHMQGICDRCENKVSPHKRKLCRTINNCRHWNKLEGFANYGNYNKNIADESKFIHNKTLFREIKIILLMVLIFLYASQQSYDFTGDFTISKLISLFKGGIENTIYLGYICGLLGLLYIEMSDLYNKKKHKHNKSKK